MTAHSDLRRKSAAYSATFGEPVRLVTVAAWRLLSSSGGQLHQVAQLPHFVFSPNTLLSVIGLIRGHDTAPPREDWRDATVAVVIPALNEQENIVRCLASVLRQTMRPHKIVVVDDGSTDATAARARAFARFHGADVVVIQRLDSIGKTPSLKDQARSLDSDVLFVLDADTVLESDDYIARTVQELYQAPGIASAWGSILPLREKDRRVEDESAAMQAFRQTFHCEQARPANTGCEGSREASPTHTARCSTSSCSASSSAGRWPPSEPCPTRRAARLRIDVSISRRSSTPWSRSSETT